VPENIFTFFKDNIDSYSLPECFTYPFYYQVHPLCQLAAKELQQHLETQTQWQHDFSLIGKMFGILLVKNQQGETGYIAGFSGKLANTNHLEHFVPPVFDMLAEDGFFIKGQDKLKQITAEIHELESRPNLEELQHNLANKKQIAKETIAAHRAMMIEARKLRKIKRNRAEQEQSQDAFVVVKDQLSKQSIQQKNALRDLTYFWKKQISKAEQQLAPLADEINLLKSQRKNTSTTLQKTLFSQYRFLNRQGEYKSLEAIFKETDQQTPPAAAGECAAPKLLQYAFNNDLEPLAMAEFWWGSSPKSAIRQHQNFYPACQSKCKPILNHMLAGIEMDENPLLNNPAKGKNLEIVYADDVMLVINKPAEFLSVPGKNIKDSVYLRIQQAYPSATGPLIVHRLDMSTSGLMVIALRKDAHKILQKQFIRRTVKKRYIAVLEGVLEGEQGTVELPLRVDLDDRPRQLVCYEYGKMAKTNWQVIERRNKRTKVYFEPITGRTHQLRVHSAHISGLNMPIVGDDLYGKKEQRLHLHAERLTLDHPVTNERMQFQVDAVFP